MSRSGKYLRIAAAILLGFAALLVCPPARATTSCSATMTNLAFGAVVPNGAAVQATATLNYSCTYTGLLSALFGDYIRLCFSIGTGSTGTGYSPRTMTDAAGDVMNFQMYSDSGRSNIWGGTGSSFSVPQVTMNFTILASGTSQSGSLTVYGLVPAAQAALGAGTYQSQFNAANTQLTYAYNEVLLSLGTFPTTCTNGSTGNGTGTFPFSVSAPVQPSCTLTGATNLGFGSVASNFSGNLNASSTITMNCIYRTAWQVGLDNGLHAVGTTRRMILGTGTVIYELYRDNGHSQRWGNTLNTDTQTGAGTGAAQSLTVYGQVLPQSKLAAGSYSDKITVTVTY